MASSLERPRRFRPRLEELEDRRVPSGFAYDPATQTLSVTADGGSNYFSYRQATTAQGGTIFTFNLDGTTQTYSAAALAHVIVRFSGSGNTADLYTNDTYTGTDGMTHETAEIVSLGQGGGQLYRTDGAGNPALFLQLSGFDHVYAYAGRADSGQFLATPGVRSFLVTTPAYGYLTSGNAFYLINGTAYTYAYAANSDDEAYHYGGNGASTYVASAHAYSFMTGTDNGQSFYNEADGFWVNYGFAQNPGQDLAIFYDSPANDVFAGYTSYSYLYANNPDGTLTYYDKQLYFAQVYAYSFVGGTDDAYVYDPGVNHTTGFIRIV